jgi:hypothetical protein
MFSRIASAIGATALIGGALLGFTAPAQAESAPGCGSVTQIGSTAYIKSGGVNIASVKQFKGCNKNWAYTYVWQGFRDSHSGTWWACTGITNGTLVDYKCGGNHQAEVWSSGANTLSDCTKAYGQLEWGGSGEGSAATDQRC